MIHQTEFNLIFYIFCVCIRAMCSWPATSTGSLATQRHPGKFPKVPGPAQRALYRDVMRETYGHLGALGEAPPARLCSHPRPPRPASGSCKWSGRPQEVGTLGGGLPRSVGFAFSPPSLQASEAPSQPSSPGWRKRQNCGVQMPGLLRWESVLQKQTQVK